MKNKNIYNILIIAFVLRFILLLINNYIFILPHGDGDAIAFERDAYLISISDYNLELKEYLSSGTEFFSLLLSFIYYFIGRQPLILGLFMVFLGTYLVQLVYKASLYLWNNFKFAKWAAWFTALFPLLMLESALVLREIPIMVLSVLGIIAFIKFWKYKQKRQIFNFILFIVLASLLHSGMIAIFIGYIIFLSLYSKSSNILTKIFSILLVLGTLYIMNQTEIGTNKFGGSFDNTFELLKKREQNKTKGGSKYPDWMRLSGTSSDLMLLPVRYVTFLFSPLFPWLVRSLWHTLGLIDAFLYLWLFFVIFKYRKILKYNETAKAILIMVLMTSLVFSLGVTNVGTATRHRAKIAPLLIIIASGMNKQQYQYYLQLLKSMLNKKKKIS